MMQQKSLFKNIIYKAILSFVNIMVPVIIGSYIVHLLDVDLYGAYNKVYSEFQVFLTFASFGIYTFGIREISKIRDDKKKISQLFTNLFVISIITNLITLIIYIVYSLLTSSGITTTIYLLMTIQLVANIFYIEFVNEALENYKFITIKSVIIKILYMISLYLFVKKPNDIVIYTIIVSMTIVLNNIASFIYAKKRITFDFSSINFKKYLMPMFTILIITNVDLLYSQLDRVMLGKFISDVSVTMYYIPYYLISMLVSIPFSIITVSIPRLSYVLENKGKQEYLLNLSRIISSLYFVIIPMCFGVLVLANEAIFLYAGEKYMAMVPTLIVACLSRIIITSESMLTHLVSYPNNKEKQLLRFSLCFGTSNLIMNSLLIYFKIFNPITALITTTIAEFGFALSQYIYAKKKLDLNIHIFTKESISYLLLSICFIPISLIIRLFNLGFWLNLILIVVICMAFYIGILYLRKDDNLILASSKIFRKIKLILRRNSNE